MKYINSSKYVGIITIKIKDSFVNVVEWCFAPTMCGGMDNYIGYIWLFHAKDISTFCDNY